MLIGLVEVSSDSVSVETGICDQPSDDSHALILQSTNKKPHQSGASPVQALATSDPIVLKDTIHQKIDTLPLGAHLSVNVKGR